MNDVIDDRNGDNRPCSFDEWINHFFNYNAVTHEQYWELRQHKEDYVLSCENEDADYLIFFTRLFEDPVTSLAAFNDTQINFGMWTVVNDFADRINFGSWNGTSYALDEADVPWAKHAMELLYNFYEQIFELRCDWNVDEKAAPLNSVCHMWWDIVSEQGRVSDQPEINNIAIEVLERIVTDLTNPFCWWSALHGLGHYHNKDEKRIERIIDTFLAAHPDLDPWLREYALAARTGSIL